MPRAIRPELVDFIELNANEKAKGKKPGKIMSPERIALIHKHFPQATKINWRIALQDPDLWGRFLKDLSKPASGETMEQALERLRRLTGNDYSYEPFPVAFRSLAGSRSVRHLATKLGLNPQMVWRLKTGKMEPDLRLIEKIAKGFGKEPAYFAEWRIAYVLGALGDQLERSPETSVDLYKKLRRRHASH